MPVIVNPPIMGALVGETPATGIVFARLASAAWRPVLSYDETPDQVGIGRALVVTPPAVSAALDVLTARNASANVAAQAVLRVGTTTVDGYLAAANVAAAPGLYVGVAGAQSLYFATASATRGWFSPSGTFVVGASAVGGTELIQVAGGVRLSGRLVVGAQLTVAEVLATPVSTRLTFYGDGSGWQFRFARQVGYGGTPVDVLTLSDTCALMPSADNAGALGQPAQRWAAAYVVTAKLGASVAGVRPEALVVGGDTFLTGYAAVYTANDNALVVANPVAGTLPFRVNTNANEVLAALKFFVGANEANALFAANGTIPSVRIGNGSPAGSVPLIVNGTVALWNSITMNNVLLFDRNAVAGWTRLYAADGRIAASFSDLAGGYRMVIPADSFEVWDHTIAQTHMLLDLLTTATQLGLAVNHNGSLKRIQVGGASGAAVAGRILWIPN